MTRPDRTSQTASFAAVAAVALGLAGCSLGGGDPPQARITLAVVDAALAAGAPDMALRIADLILAKQPDNAAALTARGDSLYAMGQVSLARDAYRAAVQHDPQNAEAFVGLGRTLIRADPKAAESAFATAAKLQPKNTVALSDLGVARDMQQNHAGAQEAYRAALAVEPDMADTRMNLGLSLALSGQAAEAVAMLRPLVVASDATELWRADLAVAMARAGDAQGARRMLLASDNARPMSTSQEPPAQVAEDFAATPEAPPIAVPAPLVPVEQQATPAAVLPAAHAAMTAPQAPAVTAAPKVPVVSVAPQVPAASAASQIAVAPQVAAVTATAIAHTTTAEDSVGPLALAVSAHVADLDGTVPPSPAVATVHPAAEALPEPQQFAKGWVAWAQVAAVSSEQDVAREWQRLQSRVAALRGQTLTVVAVEVHGSTWWRLRIGAFPSLDGAKAVCQELKAAGSGCLPIVSKRI